MTTGPRMPSPPTERQYPSDEPRPADAEALRLLGIARRAGALVAGSEAVKGAARSGTLRLVVFARDASDNARGRVEPLLKRAGVGSLVCGDRNSLGAALGKGPTAVAGVTDDALAALVMGTI